MLPTETTVTNTLLLLLSLLPTLSQALPISDLPPTHPISHPDSSSTSSSSSSSAPTKPYKIVLAALFGTILFALLATFIIYLYRTRHSEPTPDRAMEVEGGGGVGKGVVVVELADRREDELGWKVEGEGEKRRREGLGRSVIVETVEWEGDEKEKREEEGVEEVRVVAVGGRRDS